MLENLHLDKLSGTSLSEVFGKLLEKIPGWEQVVSTLEKVSTVLFIIGIVLALLQCFIGYKIRKYWTGIDGLVVCGVVGAAIAFYNELGTGAIIGIAVGAGLTGALLGYFLWFVGCFFRALFFVSIAVFSIFASLDMPVIGLIVGLAAGLIAGILEAAFNKPFMLAYTSVAGAFTAVYFLTELVPAIAEPWFVPVLVGAVLSVAGIVLQALTNRKKKEKSDAKEAFREETAAQDMALESESGSEGVKTEEVAEPVYMIPEENGKADAPLDLETESADQAESLESPAKGIVLENPAEESVDVAKVLMDAQKEPMEAPAEFASAAEEIKGTEEETVQEISGPEEKKYCTNCGAECKLNAKFCIKCGQKL